MRTMLLVVLVTLLGAAAAPAAEMLSLFPEHLAGATRTAAAKAYDNKTIYDYMDGGADPYRRYDLRQLYAAEYSLEGKLITVELFDMGSSAEAYGVFSMHQEGAPAAVGQGARWLDQVLRAWMDRYFLKIAGEADTPEFRAFAVALGGRFAQALGANGDLPDLVTSLPVKELQLTQLCYLHAVQDFNFAYYVSTDNVLLLAKGRTEAVVADGRLGGPPLKVAVIRYRDPKDRAQALARFGKIILSKKATRDKDGTLLEEMSKQRVTALRPFSGPGGEPMLALCFEARTPGKARAALAALAAGKPAR